MWVYDKPVDSGYVHLINEISFELQMEAISMLIFTVGLCYLSSSEVRVLVPFKPEFFRPFLSLLLN